MSDIRKALVAAVADMANPAKNSKNPHFRSSYADLVAVLGVVRPALAGHGLAVTQTIELHEGGAVLVTMLHHEGGDHMSLGSYPIKPTKNDPQGVGSAITYARRYSLMAAFGLGAQDDDGNAASRPPARPAARPPARPPAAKQAEPKGDGVTYDTVEEALSEIARADTDKLLGIVAEGIRGSGFKGSDAQRLRDAYKARQEELDAAYDAEQDDRFGLG